MTRLRHRFRLPALGFVLALHGLFWIWPFGHPVPVASPADMRMDQPPMVWLLDSARRPQPPQAKAPANQTVQSAPHLPRKTERQPRATLDGPPLAAPSDRGLVAPSLEVPAAAALPPDGPVRTDAAATQIPDLNLSLPRSASAPWRRVNPAVQAQIGGAAPRTVESGIANAAAHTGPWSQERIGDNRVLMRRGDTCFTLDRPRTAQLFPMDPSSQRLPWLASAPFKC